jgi:hypothetical protein
VSIDELIKQLLINENKTLLPRSFSFGDMYNAVRKVNPKFPKNKLIGFIKLMDKDGNGSTSTE